ncbi:hypothetical protein MXB_5196 [Myxobolus squamalis]|nr:hypothetical protein MXB_5196 [Myxobolus squamalis]
MAFDDKTELFVPIFFGLVENRSKWIYLNFFHIILVSTELKFELASITLDFERAMLNAVRDHLPNTVRVGRLFQYKQALKESWPSYEFQKPRLCMQCRQDV